MGWGLLIKGGKYRETLARADVLLRDKTGTRARGRPQRPDVRVRNGLPEADLFALAATAVRYSEHPRAATRAQGLRQIALLTGDNAAAALAAPLGVSYRAHLRPEDKIAVVPAYRAPGPVVGMEGDEVNAAPARAQADVGSAIAVEARPVVLLGDDWGLVPEALRMSRRTMRVVGATSASRWSITWAGWRSPREACCRPAWPLLRSCDRTGHPGEWGAATVPEVALAPGWFPTSPLQIQLTLERRSSGWALPP